MTEREMTELFSRYPFQDAKRMLIEECEKNGVQLMGHETVFELRNKALMSHIFNGKTNSTNPNTKMEKAENIDGGQQVNDDKEKPEEEIENTEEKVEETKEDKNNSNGKSEEDKSKENNNDKKNEVEESEGSGDKENETEGKEQSEKNDQEGKTEPKKRDRSKKRKPEEKEQDNSEINRAEKENNTNRHSMTDEVVKRLKCLHKAFLVGPAGTGKSTLAICSCRELFGIVGSNEDVVKSGKFAQISFSPDTISADIIGFTDVNGVFHETDIVRVFRDGGVILFDEMDDADASILVKLNTMLANRIVATPNGIVVQNPNTYIIGTANTYGTGGDAVYVGRNRLDGSTLDRWRMATISVNYDTDLEEQIAREYLDDDTSYKLRSCVHTIRRMILDNKWRYICSTRFVEDSCKMIHAGYSLAMCLNTLMMSWNELNSRAVKNAVQDILKPIGK